MESEKKRLEKNRAAAFNCRPNSRSMCRLLLSVSALQVDREKFKTLSIAFHQEWQDLIELALGAQLVETNMRAVFCVSILIRGCLIEKKISQATKLDIIYIFIFLNL